MYRILVSLALLALGFGCAAQPKTSEYATFDLDDYGRMDRREFIETIRPFAGSMVFVQGRITIDRLSSPNSPHVDDGDGRIYPCTNNPFDVPADEYLAWWDRVRAGLVPHPWFFNSKFVSYTKDSAASVDMDIDHRSFSPVKEVAFSEIYGKCVTLLVKVTGKMDISATTSAGTLYIHNVYDTEPASAGKSSILDQSIETTVGSRFAGDLAGLGSCLDIDDYKKVCLENSFYNEYMSLIRLTYYLNASESSEFLYENGISAINKIVAYLGIDKDLQHQDLGVFSHHRISGMGLTDEQKLAIKNNILIQLGVRLDDDKHWWFIRRPNGDIESINLEDHKQ